MPAIELGKQVELGALGFAGRREWFWMWAISFSISVCLAVDVSSLINAGQKRRLPVLRLGDREPAGAHHDETGQVLVLRAEAVEHPGADAWAAPAGPRRNS